MKAEGLAKRGDVAAARRLYEEILERYPQNRRARGAMQELSREPAATGTAGPPPEALVRRLIALYSAGELRRAAGPAQRLASQHPDDPLLQNLLGAILAGLDKPASAVTFLERAVHLKPDYLEALNNLAAVYVKLRRIEAAAATLETVLRHDPSSLSARANLAYQRQKLADWKDIQAGRDTLVEAGVDGEPVNPFRMMVFDEDPLRHRRRASNYARRLYGFKELERIETSEKRPERLKIGYFSADFHEHATMHLMIRMFELHDSQAFDIHSYSFGPPSDSPLRKRLTAVSHFHDVRHLSDLEIARQARDDGIAIAVDLKGYTEHARPGIFAWRAAPVQVSYLGYPGTTGAPGMDYVLADRVVIPEQDQRAYSESVVYLPNCYQVNDDTRVISGECPSREECGLPREAFVFCCFNSTYKITPEAFDSWMRLLKAIDGSVLWLLNTNGTATGNLRREAERRGVDPQRVVFADRAPPAEHLARHRLADLFLDTFTYNAHTTASDALWAGLPVITAPGRTFPARVAASMLLSLGLEEAVCETRADYEALALDLARDPERLARLRRKLDVMRKEGSLFATAPFTSRVETAYEALYRRYLQGLPPASIRIDA